MTQKKPNDKLKKSINMVLIVLVVFLSLVQIVLSNRIATWGRRLKDIEEEIKKVEESNAQQELEILSYGRLHQLSEKATSLGFVKNASVLNLTSQIPVALKSE